MSIAYTAARLVLGLAFVAAAVSDVYFTNNPAPVPPGLAATFQDVFFRSHWVLFVGAMQLLSGALLLANRFVPLALTIAGGILFNIVAYHVTIMPVGLPLAFVAVGLWMLVAIRHRATFAPLFA